MIRLAVDLLGADTSEEELCRGALMALAKDDDLFLWLCGHEETIRSQISQIPGIEDRCAIAASPIAITNYDDPMAAYRQPEASLVRAMQLAHREADGVITCGATGAVLVSAIMILGKLRGLRPVLAVELTNRFGNPLLLLDCGANIDSRPDLYPSFAHLGDAYMRCIGYSSPRIGLLSNGSEETKGCAAVKEAHALLKSEPIHFIGNVEATQILQGVTDVVVCDGFHGNILLKSIEGTAKAVIGELEELISIRDGVEAEALRLVRTKYDYNTQGGAVLLGVRKIVMKGHGSATGEAVAHMVERAATLARNRFVEKVESVC